jgi:hypothetical protein
MRILAEPNRAIKAVRESMPTSRNRLSSRADFGAPIAGFIRKQPAHLRVILQELRGLVEATVPGARSSLKWGMPCFTLAGNMMCMLGGHKSHVNLVLVGPPAGFDDPAGRLEGAGKGGRHLKLASLEDLPRASVRKWLRAAAEYARSKEIAA